MHHSTYQPKVSFSISATKAKVKTSFNQDTSTYSYDTVSSGGSHVLTFSYSQSDKDKDKYAGGIESGSYSLTYTAKSDIYLEGTQIKNVTSVNANVHLKINGDSEKGDWASYSLTSYYDIGVDAQGQLSVTQSSDDMVDNSDKVKTSTWDDMISAGTMDDVIDSIQSDLKKYLQGIIVDDSSTIASMLNGSTMWVFPGGQTFTFQDAKFSDNQDLVTHVSYLDSE
jgi:hypothetical protein